ncbi:MAG: OB-fold nucleic acid binding domain-containing protein, partial [Solirubrobacterales bacterium]
RPTEFQDLVALVALYRPGAMRYIGDYAKGKRKPDSVIYRDRRLRTICQSTYGCVIYQEQLMEIAKQMAGFSPAQADDLRKAVGKKKRDLMATMKDKFLEGMAASNTDKRVAQDLWSLMEAAADYSFNRSHAACYALIAYRTAWLRANYCAEYMAALISTVMSTKDKVPFFVNRCDEMGIEVLPPDVNTSDHGFVVSGNSIRFGLDAVKNVGHVAVQAILDAREQGGEFSSIWDFCARVDTRAVNKRAVECLVKCGALDSTGAPRRGMLEAVPAATAFGQKAQEDSRMGQSSIFDLGGTAEDTGRARSQHAPIPAQEFDKRELLRLEKETLGTYLSSHPLAEVKDALRARVDCPISQLESRADGSLVTVGGIVTECRRIRTKRGDPMMFATLDDVEGQVEMLILGQAMEESGDDVQSDAVLVVKGRLDHKERGDSKLLVQEIEVFQPTEDEVAKARAARDSGPLRLTIDAAAFGASLIEELKGILEHFPGDAEVVLVMKTREGRRELRFGREYRVRRSAGLNAELDALLGSGSRAAA